MSSYKKNRSPVAAAVLLSFGISLAPATAHGVGRATDNIPGTTDGLSPQRSIDRLGIGNEVDRSDLRTAELNFSLHGGYLVVDSSGNLVCGKSNVGLIDAAKCDAEKTQLAERQMPRNVAARLEPKKTAAIPFVAIGLAAITCGAVGFITASLVEQQNTILIVNYTASAQATVLGVGGTASSVRAAGQLVRHVAPQLPKASRGLAALGVGGAICGASMGAGYGVFHFFFRKPSDVGEPAQ